MWAVFISLPEFRIGFPRSGGIYAADAAGELASFNAHTDAFGTLVENDPDDQILFGIIDKIMSMFE